VKKINGMIIAEICNKLGAGRQFSNQQIDPAVGVQLLVKIGDYIKNDTQCIILYHNEIDLDKSFLISLQNSIELTDKVVQPENILLGVIDCNS
jgi:thymidine phosphorylase